MFRILTIIFVIVRISRNIEATTQSSKFRLISNLNLSDSWSMDNLIETINIPQTTGRKNFNQKRYCLAECDKLSTCILSVYDSVGLTCTFYNSGPEWSNGNYLSAQYSYIKTFYKQLSPSQCSVYQYHDGYSCGINILKILYFIRKYIIGIKVESILNYILYSLKFLSSFIIPTILRSYE